MFDAQMKDLLLPVLSLVLAVGGCSEKTAVVTGQIFVVTKGGQNIKMGSIPVHVIPEEQFKETVRKLVVKDTLLNELNELEPVKLHVPDLVHLRREIENESEARRQKVILGFPLQDELRALVQALPSSTARTDADGRFTVEVSSKVWMVAWGGRHVGGVEEEYFWVLPYEPSRDALPQTVLISNDADVDSKEDLCARLAPLIGKDWSIDAFVNREPNAAVVQWAVKVKERASTMVLDAKRLVAEAKAKAESKIIFTNPLGMKFVPIPGTQIWMCIHETRNQDYAAYMAEGDGVNGEWEEKAGAGKEQCPVVNVSYKDAESFCRWLSTKEGKTYRLPTDAEWSIAIGLAEEAGRTPKEKEDNTTDELYPWGKYYPPTGKEGNYGLDEVNDGYEGVARVITFQANELGIYELGGNVWEWCQDFYNSNPNSCVLRGASWSSKDRSSLRSTYRSPGSPMGRRDDYGFRCVIVATGS